MGRGTLTPQEEELKKIISNNIRIKIKEEGISQAEFARRAGIPPTTLSGYVKGVTRPNAGNLQKISDTFGILKSDIDPSYKQGYSIEDWQDSQNKSSVLSKITKISSQLEEARQKIVLDTAKLQLKEQDEQNKIKKIEDYRLSDEYLEEQINKASAYGGGRLNDNDKEFFKRLLKNTLKEKIDKGDL